MNRQCSLLLSLPVPRGCRVAEIQATHSMFERWIKGGCTEYPELAPAGDDGAGAAGPEDDEGEEE